MLELLACKAIESNLFGAPFGSKGRMEKSIATYFNDLAGGDASEYEPLVGKESVDKLIRVMDNHR
jgi:hypothetical protein